MQIEAVDADDHSVHGKIKRRALVGEFFDGACGGVDGFVTRTERRHRNAEFLEIGDELRVRRERGQTFALAATVSDERQTTRGDDLWILVLQRADTGITSVGEELLAVLLTLFVDALELAHRHEDLATNLKHRRNPAPALSLRRA